MALSLSLSLSTFPARSSRPETFEERSRFENDALSRNCELARRFEREISREYAVIPSEHFFFVHDVNEIEFNFLRIRFYSGSGRRFSSL